MEVVVFTNGCFDILHVGHIELLQQAKKLGTKLIVGINSDRSVRAIKGNPRPFVSENDRATILDSLACVDEVIIFDEQTPLELIKKINPDVLVKGGDWQVNEIIGADFVLKRGGKVHSIPLKDGFSTTELVNKIKSFAGETKKVPVSNENLIHRTIKQHLDVFNELVAESIESIESCGKLIVQAIDRGNKILLCGNGGSAGDAQHIATELICRYEKNRKSFPAIALTTDTSAITAIGNDFDFEHIFSRQIEGLAQEGDVLIGISTSGNSPNILRAVMSARQQGCITIGLTGAKGKKLASLCDKSILVPSDRTARIQEAHITIGHIWCEMVESKF